MASAVPPNLVPPDAGLCPPEACAAIESSNDCAFWLGGPRSCALVPTAVTAIRRLERVQNCTLCGALPTPYVPIATARPGAHPIVALPPRTPGLLCAERAGARLRVPTADAKEAHGQRVAQLLDRAARCGAMLLRPRESGSGAVVRRVGKHAFPSGFGGVLYGACGLDGDDGSGGGSALTVDLKPRKATSGAHNIVVAGTAVARRPSPKGGHPSASKGGEGTQVVARIPLAHWVARPAVAVECVLPSSVEAIEARGRGGSGGGRRWQPRRLSPSSAHYRCPPASEARLRAQCARMLRPLSLTVALQVSGAAHHSASSSLAPSFFMHNQPGSGGAGVASPLFGRMRRLPVQFDPRAESALRRARATDYAQG